MVTEKSSNEQRRGSRRRYFRSRSQKGKGDGSSAAPKQAEAKPAHGGRSGSDSRVGRTGRRRRRSRSQNATPNPVEQAPVDSIVNLEDYVPPKDIFVYTHVLRSSNRDSYEFRAERFSKLGRRLEDYEIDLSSLYADDNRADEE